MLPLLFIDPLFVEPVEPLFIEPLLVEPLFIEPPLAGAVVVDEPLFIVPLLLVVASAGCDGVVLVEGDVVVDGEVLPLDEVWAYARPTAPTTVNAATDEVMNLEAFMVLFLGLSAKECRLSGPCKE